MVESRRSEFRVFTAWRLAACLFAAGLALASTGCGFQLRGAAELPAAMATTLIRIDDSTTAFARNLSRRLEANGVRVVGNATDAGAILDIPVARVRREAVSISGAARVREYRLNFDVAFRLVTPDGATLLESQDLTLARDYSFDEQEILASTREEEFLRDELYRAMVDQVIRRLEAAGP